MQNEPDIIKFGTDGWRAVISDTYTFKNVARVAQAIAAYYLNSSKPPLKIAVGYDTRFLSEKYARRVAEVLAANSIDVILSDRAVPTPTLSYAVQHLKCTAGVMITASHNPGDYNGIKIKNSAGGAASVEITRGVEKLLPDNADTKNDAGAKISTQDLSKAYVAFLRKYVNLKKMKTAKYKVLVDVMHGSGNGFIGEVLKGSRMTIDFLRRERNPWFGGLRPEPVTDNLQDTMKLMKKRRYDVCLVLDGDADRIAAVLPGGEFVSPQKILGLLALHLFQDKKMNGGVVKTIVGTNLLDNLTQDLGVRLFETPVGFKYISALMESENILVGGEEAGGMGFKNFIPERDGSLAGLLLLEMMVDRKKKFSAILAEMEAKYGRYYYLRDDMHISTPGMNIDVLKNTTELLNKRVVEMKDYDGIKLIREDKSWLMFRSSGTEPIMRVYAEAASLSVAKQLLLQGRKMILDLESRQRSAT